MTIANPVKSRAKATTPAKAKKAAAKALPPAEPIVETEPETLTPTPPTIRTLEVSEQLIAKITAAGDLSSLTPAEKNQYYQAICQMSGLNPILQPFAFLAVDGRVILYAKKSATDELRRLHGINVLELTEERIGDLHHVRVKMQDQYGRTDFDIGVAAICPIGEQRKTDKETAFSLNAQANAVMRACTKAKRRCTLSLCGLAILDESEIETVTISAKELINRIREARLAAGLEQAQLLEIIKKQFEDLNIMHPADLNSIQVADLIQHLQETYPSAEVS
jgi:hypothetical protein